MTQQMTCQVTSESLLYDEGFWKALYDKLRKPVATFVRRYKIPPWTGQEDDMVDDIIQETVMRLYKKFLASPDEVFSIQNMEAFAYTVAQRYCLDLRRKDKRLTRLPQEGNEVEMRAFRPDDELTKVLEAMTMHTILTDAARIITNIPTKQRRAILVDLARLNDFTETPTPVEQAFAEAGIQLGEYRHLFPQSQPERSRHNALVSLGYRRLRTGFHTTSTDHQGSPKQSTGGYAPGQHPSSYLH
jgi:DNA-directed RNA polymerase specialized sigma24 family protein